MNHEPGFHLSRNENLSKGWGPPLCSRCSFAKSIGSIIKAAGGDRTDSARQPARAPPQRGPDHKVSQIHKVYTRLV